MHSFASVVLFVALAARALGAVISLSSSTVEVDGIAYYVPGTPVVLGLQLQ